MLKRICCADGARRQRRLLCAGGSFMGAFTASGMPAAVCATGVHRRRLWRMVHAGSGSGAGAQRPIFHKDVHISVALNSR
jgi:hypothetical protein